MRRYLILFLLFLVAVAATRLPAVPGQLYSFDEVNMVYGMDKLDTRLSQPQPPGYPLFILEMHVLRLLRFVRPESILIALSILGSAAAMVGLVWCGDRMFGGWTGIYGALLLGLHPGFWYTGLTSALRIQLALISAVVAGACWRAWRGEARWTLYGALALGLGAGIRPEVGPLLVPLWAVGVVRAPAGWKLRLAAIGTLIGAVLIWLVPLTLSSGGFVAFFRHCWAYLVVQSQTTSTLFGLEPTKWTTIAIHLLIWSFSGIIFLPMLAVLARGAEGSIGRLRWTFLAFWIGPALLFAWFVHVADTGHTLAIVAPVCLFLGHQVSRAVEMRKFWRAPEWSWAVPLVVVALLPLEGPGYFRLLTLLIALAAAVAARWRADRPDAPVAPALAATLIFLPVAIFSTHTVFGGGWHYEARRELSATRLWLDVKYAFHLSSYQHVRQTVDPDDAALQAAKRLVEAAPERSVIVSERSLTSWRKVSYYLPTTRLFVLEKLPLVPPQVVVSEWLRSVQKGQRQGAEPQAVSLPVGSRIIWMVNPRSSFGPALRQSLMVREEGSVAYTDLPATAGSSRIGDYVFDWK